MSSVEVTGLRAMDFPLLDLLDDEISAEWVIRCFHPNRFGCPHCEAGFEQAPFFRDNRGSGLPVYHCRNCREPEFLV